MRSGFIAFAVREMSDMNIFPDSHFRQNGLAPASNCLAQNPVNIGNTEGSADLASQGCAASTITAVLFVRVMSRSLFPGLSDPVLDIEKFSASRSGLSCFANHGFRSYDANPAITGC
jgi:hypothetical protein